MLQINPNSRSPIPNSRLPQMNYERESFTAKYYERKIYVVGAATYNTGAYQKIPYTVEMLDLNSCSGSSCNPNQLHWVNIHQLQYDYQGSIGPSSYQYLPSMNFINNLVLIATQDAMEVFDALSTFSLSLDRQDAFKTGYAVAASGDYVVGNEIYYYGGYNSKPYNGNDDSSKLHQKISATKGFEQAEIIYPTNVTSVTAAAVLMQCEFYRN